MEIEDDQAWINPMRNVSQPVVGQPLPQRVVDSLERAPDLSNRKPWGMDGQEFLDRAQEAAQTILNAEVAS
jgi:hypothetical protein